MRAPDDPKHGKVDVAEMLAMCEKAMLESWDGCLCDSNTQVGSSHSKKRARKENEASGSLDLA